MSDTRLKQERRALSIQETAQTLGISRATLYRRLKEGRITTIVLGSRRLVPVAAIDALLREGA